MSVASTRWKYAEPSYDEDLRDDFSHVRFSPEDRIGGHAGPTLRTRLLRLLFAVALTGSAAWTYVTFPDQVSEYATIVAQQAARLVQAATTTERPAAPAVAPPPVSEAAKTVADASPRPVEAAEPPPAPAEEAREDEVADQPVRLPPPLIDNRDPLQVRALAVGLHPGISRAVLARLTAVDFENAAHAIRTALGSTPEDQVFAWPARRQPGQALFQVKFVKGAPQDCRRYVVMITKDDWLTTALPMEKCQDTAGR